ncbi:GNAT family N-acetyltransferase [Demequina sp. TTPB684]|uniref:GNAT family N-acetyltransferase n=1 Tax=unclassified Demequina TaxID=2620311 RepID=UPI001CF51C46|nr:MULTISPECIES: GNAT family N-acetyltransferase [unclassified Demequina]MCB2413714.1 GNAT family N-acetyltransferase [Demequina sp. TTPB684]UPU89613.1 GNAT family N-acetyltransferase [Demequina sp. TMPB413]
MPETAWHVPHRIDTERLTLRRYRADDAEQMSRVALASKQHLATFMPWARAEPLPPADRAELLEKFMSDFDEGRDFAMGIFARNTGEYMGGAGFHTRLGPGALEIGYWVAVDHEGKGYITEAVLALTHVALTLMSAERVEIHHVPENVKSRAVPQRCGYSYDGRELTLMPGVEGVEPTDIWSATAENLTREPLASVQRPLAFDAEDNLIAWPA